MGGAVAAGSALFGSQPTLAQSAPPPGKEADIILLDANAINVAPLNHVPGAVVTLMERSNVDTVLVAGKIRKWKGRMLDADLPKLRGELESSRDYLFKASGIKRDLFRG